MWGLRYQSIIRISFGRFWYFSAKKKFRPFKMLLYLPKSFMAPLWQSALTFCALEIQTSWRIHKWKVNHISRVYLYYKLIRIAFSDDDYRNGINNSSASAIHFVWLMTLSEVLMLQRWKCQSNTSNQSTWSSHDTPPPAHEVITGVRSCFFFADITNTLFAINLCLTSFD